ncbi:hypothetical protein K432DRAFT_312104, partial [Lepidopterella palustris CBS 459.81]
RNPRVASIIGRRIKASRIQNTTPAQIQAFFNHLQSVQRKHNVQPENTWNMDEVGTALGICTNTIILAELSKKRTYIMAP